MKRWTGVALAAGAVLFGLWGAARYAFEGWHVNGDAMAPTYRSGAFLLGYKLAYSSVADVRRGDVVVVYHAPRGFDEHQVWRVAGVPGDAVDLPDGSRPVVPPGEFFLRGDNPAGAEDSTTFGPVPFARIRFKIIATLSQ